MHSLRAHGSWNYLRNTSSRHRGNNARRCIHFAHTEVGIISEIPVPVAVESNIAARQVHLSAGGGDAIPVVSAGSGACHCGDIAGGHGYLADAAVLLVRDINTPGAVDAKTGGVLQLGAGG